jgi:hypothetical protein
MSSSSHQSQNLSDRLVGIIERNAEAFTQGTVKNLQSSPRTKSYHNLPYDEIYDRVYAVYHDLGRWLWGKPSEAIRAWYSELGQKRCAEGIPLSEVLWALIFTKDRLIAYLDGSGLVDSAVGLYQQQEFDRLIGHFFDRAICYAAEGYQQYAAQQKKSSEGPHELRRSRRFWQQLSSAGFAAEEKKLTK